jgi:hypothetical protein
VNFIEDIRLYDQSRSSKVGATRLPGRDSHPLELRGIAKPQRWGYP